MIYDNGKHETGYEARLCKFGTEMIKTNFADAWWLFYGVDQNKGLEVL